MVWQLRDLWFPFEEKTMRVALLLFILLCFSQVSYSQLEDYGGMRIYLVHTSFNNSRLPGNDGEARFSLGFDAVVGRMEKGKVQFAYRAPIIEDGFAEVAKLLKGTSAETVGETFIMSLLPGWLQMGYNVVGNERLCISPGLFAGDFWYTAYIENNFIKPELRGIIEPSGWYGGLGPALFVDYALPISSPVNLHFETFYAFTNRWSESSKLVEFDNFNPEADNPHFFKARLEVRYKKTFVGYRWVKAINRYEETADLNSGSRSDIQIGFAF